MPLTLSNIYDLFFPSEDYEPQESYTEEDAQRYSEAKQELENYISEYIETCGQPQEETFVFKTEDNNTIKVKAYSLEEAMFDYIIAQPLNEDFETSHHPTDFSYLIYALDRLEAIDVDVIEMFKRLVTEVRDHHDTAEYNCSGLELVA